MIVNGIDTKDISVVVQGAISVNSTKKCLESIRKYFPGAEIILSTWRDSDLDSLDYDKLVESEDPGAYPCDVMLDSVPNNIDRQIISTQRGLELSERLYCIKVRTDFYFESNNLLQYFEKYQCFNEKYHFFIKKIICCSIYSRNPRLEKWPLAMAYCPSDFIYFGLTEDIRNLFFSIDLSSEEDKYYFDIHEDEVRNLKYKEALCRYMPEQHIWTQFISHYLDEIYCKHRDDINQQNVLLTEKTFANNLIILEPKQLGISSDKKDIFTKGTPQNCFTFGEWRTIYFAYAKNRKFLTGQFIASSWIKNHKIKNRNLIRNRDDVLKIKNISEVERYIKNYKVVSFDLFDTLIFRVPSPSWVPTSQMGLSLSLILRKYNYEISPEMINRLREEFIAEEYALHRKCGYDEEYKLDEVIGKLLKYIGVEDSKIRAIKSEILDNEINREKNAIYLNNDAISVLKKIREYKEKKVVMISDMYLSKAEIRHILDEFNIWDLFDDVYVSSEIGYTKASGRLYEYVLKELNVDAKDMIHIGDNLYSDILMAGKKNIKCLMLYNNREQERKKNSENAILLNKYIDQYVKELCFEKGVFSFDTYVRHTLGLDVWNFVYKISIDSRLDNIETLFFLERDGNLFKRIFDILSDKITVLMGSEKINTSLLKLSRTDSACLSDISSPYAVIKRAMSINPPRCFKVSHIIGCYGLKFEDFSINEQQLIKKNNYNKEFFCKNYIEIFQDKITKRRKKVLSYLESKNFFQYKKIGIVDIGWGGTIQRDIIDLIKKENINLICQGFYYACDSRIEELPGSSFYYYRNAATLWYGYSLLEFLVKEYTPVSVELDRNHKLYDTYSLNQLSRKSILECEEIYLKLINRYFLTVVNIMDYCTPLVTNMIKNPDIDFVKSLENVLFSLDRKKNDEYMKLVERVKSRKELDEQCLVAQWVQGSKKLSGFISISETGKLKKLMNRFPIVRKILWKLLNLCESNIYMYRKG